MPQKSIKDAKKRAWTFVLYPESAPADWREQLQATGLPFAVSPLHDRDLNATGEPKKAHHHIIVVYAGPTTYSNVEHLTSSLSQPVPQPLEAVRGMYRYFTHTDNPEKAQYDPQDITAANGFNIADYVELTASEVSAIKQRVLTEIVIPLKMVEYSDLVTFLLDNAMFAEFDIVSNHTIFFNAFLRSERHKTEKS